VADPLNVTLEGPVVLGVKELVAVVVTVAPLRVSIAAMSRRTVP
jgi:hypothetical protein